jgi:hypothetical protein
MTEGLPSVATRQSTSDEARQAAAAAATASVTPVSGHFRDLSSPAGPLPEHSNRASPAIKVIPTAEVARTSSSCFPGQKQQHMAAQLLPAVASIMVNAANREKWQ